MCMGLSYPNITQISSNINTNILLLTEKCICCFKDEHDHIKNYVQDHVNSLLVADIEKYTDKQSSMSLETESEELSLLMAKYISELRTCRVA